MHTCGRLRLDLKTPLGGPMSSQTTSNAQECLWERGWSMLGQNEGRVGMVECMGELEWL